jgi:hypothetical protein
MRKGIILISLFLIAISSNAQVWVDSGAVWHYDYSSLATGGYVKYIYEKDTLILNKLCQKITKSSMDFYFDINGILHYWGETKCETNFTYVSGDTVFYYRDDQFFVMYNFGASVGDTWIVSTTNELGYCNDTSSVEVTGTGTMLINGISLRYINLRPTPNSFVGLKGKYIERIGCISTGTGDLQTLFPSEYQCDSLPFAVEFAMYQFRCFEDQSFPLFNVVGEDCEALFDHVGILQHSEKELFCYPNPTNGIVNLKTPALESYSLVLYSIFGTEIQKFEISPNNSTIDMSHLPNGIYLLEFQISKNEHVVKKIVKL